jgi:hypothetical protein
MSKVSTTINIAGAETDVHAIVSAVPSNTKIIIIPGAYTNPSC